MSNKPKNGNHIRYIKDTKSGTWLRWLCALCVTVLVFACCAGCTPSVSPEEFDAVKAELTGEINRLKDANGAAQKELNELKGRYEEAQNELDSIKSDHAAAKTEMESLASDNQALQTELDTVKENHLAAQDEIAALADSNKNAQQEIDALKSDNETAKKERDALRTDNEYLQQKLESLTGINEALQQEIESLKEQIQDLQNSTTPDPEPEPDPTPDSEPEPEPNEKIRIYIDQGHNPTSYHNSGASGNGLYEEDLTFTIGCLLAERLEEDGRFEVCLSRPTADTVLGTDNPSSLAARVQSAIDFGADYFISLHINSYDADSANGIEVIVAEQDSEAYAFGSSLLGGMINATNLRDRGMKLNPELYVLQNATMPAALLEMGFISNSGDAALLSESPELFSQGIYDGILAYFELQANDLA